MATTITAANWGIAHPGSGYWSYEYKEANSQTFTANQLVYLNAGAVTVVASTGQLFTGLAGAAATNVVSGNIVIPVFHFAADTIVYLPIINNATPCAATIAYIGDIYGIILTAGVHYCDISNTTQDAVRVIGKHPNYEWGDTNLPVKCHFNPSLLTG